LKESILKGRKGDARAIVSERADGNNYEELINNEIIGALNELGIRYEKGLAFLPQLIAGSEAAKEALEYVRAKFIPEGAGGDVMLLATVKGDVHDIGKNIVKAVLQNYGYKIIDLGKDVSTEKILDAAQKYRPKFVGLSALMTTTLENMRESALSLKSKYPDIVVAVGGAVVTAEFARSIGAIYGKDAQETVKRMEEFKG
jgi:Methionine synthase I, cobalamin-binding domain